MKTDEVDTPLVSDEEKEDNVDPIHDIIDYLVRCANISFKNAHCDKEEIRTVDKIRTAYDIYSRSPTNFLLQFGKHLAPHHLGYFTKLQTTSNDDSARFQEVIKQLHSYHSDENRHRRVRNRRYKALQKLREESDYFSEKQMMLRNPLLYEQLVGQYLSDEEIQQRDCVDNENLTFLSMILETVDRNEMRELKNQQMFEENLFTDINEPQENQKNKREQGNINKKRWGDFENVDTKPSYIPETRHQSKISAPEKKLLREEFLQEMYSSFIEGRDIEIDYRSIDNDEQYDDLQQMSQDAEDRYFDSETNDVDNLEEHMKLIEEYGRKKSNLFNESIIDDPLDVFINNLNK